MNEELQSTNAEQHEINQVLATQTEQLQHAHSYLDSILSTLSLAVVVVSADLTVELWNDQAFELWGLREEEVKGRPLLSLDIGLPVDELEAPLRRCLEDRSQRLELLLDARTRLGRRVQCRIQCAALLEADQEPGAVLLMEVEPAP